MELRGMACCGLREIHGLANYNGPLETMQSVYGRITGTDGYGAPDKKWRFAVYTEANQYNETQFKQGSAFGMPLGYGTRFTAFILKNKLGSVTEVPEAQNPNTSRYIKVWVWQVDHKALDAYFVANPLPAKLIKNTKPATGGW